MAAPQKNVDAIEAEAKEDQVRRFEFDGVSYTIDLSQLGDDLETAEAYEDGRGIALVRNLMGAQQWATFKSKKRSLDDLQSLTDVILGATPGE